MPIEETEKDILAVCEEIARFLIEKNRAYGDSALSPRRIFSRCDAMEQINVRIDDKLSRVANIPDGQIDSMGEDPEKDLLGYLVLKAVGKLRAKRALDKSIEKFNAARVPPPSPDEHSVHYKKRE